MTNKKYLSISKEDITHIWCEKNDYDDDDDDLVKLNNNDDFVCIRSRL